MLATMAPPLTALLDDLATIEGDLRELLASLSAEAWDRPTPSPGWTVRHQVRHLAHGEELGRLAASDPAGFAAELSRLVADLDAVERATVDPVLEPTDDLLARWWEAAEGLRTAVADGPTDTAIDWVTGPMSRASFLTARVMETFAHGTDIAAALGATLPVGGALRHIAHLGVATRAFAFANRGLPVPDPAVRVVLTGPDGDEWTWGPEDAPERVEGPALDFCLLVTKRLHRDDTALTATGDGADAWLDVAQCFAGPPTDGPGPSGDQPDC
jgi:uncharacterized protein (TIGR03084 family)